jgi:hypothetical protein
MVFCESWPNPGETMMTTKARRQRRSVSRNRDTSTNQEKMILYEYALVLPKGREKGSFRDNSFREWYGDQVAKVRGWIFQRLMLMKQHTGSDFSMFAHGPIKEGGLRYPHIYKLKIGGAIEFRPLLCRGPVPPIQPHVVTFLLGAQEVQNRIAPSPQGAVDRRQEIIENPSLRRLLELYDERTKIWLRQDN